MSDELMEYEGLNYMRTDSKSLAVHFLFFLGLFDKLLDLLLYISIKPSGLVQTFTDLYRFKWTISLLKSDRFAYKQGDLRTT